MSQEDKELLLKDLCARLPYGVKVAIEYSEGKYTRIYDLREIDNDVTSELRQQVTVWNYGFYSSVISYPLIDCRPYLRSISSMTEEEKHELYQVFQECPTIIKTFPAYAEFFIYADIINSIDMVNVIDWFNAHHFDYRGLIEKGLALEAPEGMYN